MTRGRRQVAKLLTVAAAVLAAAALAGSAQLARIDALIFDASVRLRGDPPAAPITIVAIDDRALAEYGRWPWPRRLQARLLREIAAAGPATVGLTIVYADPDPDPAADRELVDALCALPRLVQPVVPLPPGAGPDAVLLPLPELRGCAAGLGHVAVPTDPDGMSRRLALELVAEGHAWPSFTEMLMRAGRDAEAPAAEPPTLDGPGIAEGPRGEVLPTLPARRGRVVVLSAAAVLGGDVDAAHLRGRDVLVGVTAPTVASEVTVPVEGMPRRLSGVAFQAHALDALLHGRVLVPLAPWPAAVLAALATLAGLLAGLQRDGGLRWLPLTLAVTAAAALAAQLAGWWLPPAAALAAAGLGHLGWALYRRIVAARALQAERRRAQVALEAIGDGLVTTDLSGRIDYVNPTAERLLGWPRAELQGRLPSEALRFVELDEGRPVEWPGSTPDSSAARLGLVGADGEPRPVRATVAPMLDARGRPEGWVMALGDVSREHKLLGEIAMRATRDELTGLPNRALFRDRLDHALEIARRSDRQLAVVFIDIDRFKAINDALGHDIGDRVLCIAAERLSTSARRSDTLARLGGDEFVVLLEDLQLDGVLTAVRRYAEALDATVVADGHELRLSASVGVALFPHDGGTADELMRHADLAMYRAKEEGRERIRFFTADMSGAAIDRLTLDRELRAALRERQIELHYQPQVEIASARISGLECLARWRHPSRGLVPPARFIPFAEETGLICDLGRVVIEDGLAQLAKWSARRPDLRLAVNLSVVQLKRDAELVDFICDRLRVRGIAPDRLELEVTEGMFLDPGLAVLDERLRALAQLGVHLSIDDFGTGYSSLAYLSRFPFSRIKVDRSFVRGIETDHDARTIVRTIVELGHSLRKAIVAEGVETEDQLAFLREVGCDEVQGFLLGPPNPAQRLPV